MKQSKKENEINSVLKYQENELEKIKRPDMSKVNKLISESENILLKMGYQVNENKNHNTKNKTTIRVPSWEEMCLQAQKTVGNNVQIDELFSKEELNENELAIELMKKEYNAIHKLDNIDLTICVSAGLLASVIDILLVGIPQKTNIGIKAGKLSDYVRQWFEKEFPEEEMEKIAN